MSKELTSVLDMKEEEFTEFLDSFDHVVSDCDGVIWTNTVLEGVGDFFSLMKKLGKTVNFASNSSIRTKENYEKMFKSAGIENGYENLTIPSLAIMEYLHSVSFDKNKYVYCVASTETIHVLKSHGFKCKDGPDLGPESYFEYVQFFEEDDEIGAVVFDSDIRINLAKMHRAITYLKRPDVLFLSGSTDRRWPLRKGLLCLGSGALTSLVMEEVDRQPVILAKPGKAYGDLVVKRSGITSPSRVLFIGDTLEQDIGLGKTCGFKTLLVLTYATVEDAASHHYHPDYYAPSLASMLPQLKKYCNISNGH